jgi:hypothetical protein
MALTRGESKDMPVNYKPYYYIEIHAKVKKDFRIPILQKEIPENLAVGRRQARLSGDRYFRREAIFGSSPSSSPPST